MKAAALLCFLLLVPIALAFPSPTGYVNDFAGVIEPSVRADMEAVAKSVEAETTAEISAVTVSSAGDYTPREYATALFNDWKIGKADKDNGLLILYVLDAHRVEVETGYGVEGILPDGKVGRILDEYYVPQRDSNLSKALLDTESALAAVIIENKDEVLSGQAAPQSDLPVFVFFILLLWGVPMAAAVLMMLPPKCDACKVRMKKLRTDRVRDGLFSTYYTVYKCPKCGRTKRRQRRTGGAVFVAGGGFHGGGGFGGFGGGGSGGGGAGR